MVGINLMLNLRFKIDLIVWKSKKKENTPHIISKFKIDLIVWKFITWWFSFMKLKKFKIDLIVWKSTSLFQ